MRRWLKFQLLRYYRKMVREKAPVAYIARGWAIGMFYGCVIPFGFQLALSIPTAFLLRGSKIGATLGTFITNQVTIFVIYPVQCWVGSRLLGSDLSYASIVKALQDVFAEQSWSALMRLGGDLFEAFFLGGALLAAVCVPLTYFGVSALVRRARLRKSA